MRARTPILLALSCLAGLLPHAGPGGVLERAVPDPWSLAVHVGAPTVLAVYLAVSRPWLPWLRSALLLAGCLLLAQTIRMVLFALPTGWQLLQRLSVDSKHQFLLALSLSMQMAAGSLAFAAVRILARRNARRTASARTLQTPGRTKT